ncbi:MAG: cytidylate kinase-like family protein [Desulfobacteraceae bacterium]|nr:cytidylate kinase-like family protein [Desulfobacteraceae bacterium]
MSIIAISRCSYTHGKDVAEAVAKTLGFTCISREELLDAPQEFNMHGLDLARELPIFLEQNIFNKYRYISYIRSALLRHLSKDNIVYHGFCENVFLKDIDHVLKVQITADLEDRVKLVMERNGLSRSETLLLLKTLDDARKNWCQKLYKNDLSSMGQYDISFNISKFPRDRAVNIICKAVQLKRFQTTPESSKTTNELFINSDIKQDEFSDNHVKRISLMACLIGV